MQDGSRYIIGIDLGTTNSAVAYVDTDTKKNPSLAIQLFRIPQIVGPGRVEALPLLPSFYYLAGKKEFLPQALDLPWGQGHLFAVGHFAREQGAKVPTRLIQSAKSWLSNASAHRKDPFLPLEAADEERRLSPVDVSAAYLGHLKEAWNATIAKGHEELMFEQQEMILTVPASFDEIARSLTLEAAREAGLLRLTLLEEPQAAFYHWLMENPQWNERFQLNEGILVCDVGGGTTDFTWIETEKNESGVTFQRRAVGPHLLLGGDNMDRTLASVLEKKCQGIDVGASQWLELHHYARQAKESLLSPSPSSHFSIWLEGEGSQLVGGGTKIELERDETIDLLTEGFFKLHSFSEAVQMERGSGIHTMGLPYERDPSITKHLARFIQKSGLSRKPAYVLFNGGVMKPPVFRERIVHSLDLWFPDQPQMTILESSTLDLAVAKGAAFFGKCRRGVGVQITGGSSRGYYLEIDVKDAKGDRQKRALTLLPKGGQEGVRYMSDYLFSLLPNTPVSFQLYHSHTRLGDAKGALVPIVDEEMTPLPPLYTLLRYGKNHSERIPVHLGIHLTQIGTLELWVEAQQTAHRWSLEFQLRGSQHEEQLMSSQAPIQDQALDQSLLQLAQRAVIDSFSIGNSEQLASLMPALERLLGLPRQEWPLSLLRHLFDAALQQASKRELSSFYESRWWNIVGFFLRPGVGYALDDCRIKELWKIMLADSKKQPPEEVQIQQWICYRRSAGGLNRGQQMQVFTGLLPTFMSPKAVKREYAYTEKLRTLASLELVDVSLKIKLGNSLLKKIQERKATPADYWALGRLGGRQLMWGGVANIIPRAACEEWVQALLNVKGADPVQLSLLLSALSRKTDIRELNLSEEVLKAVSCRLKDLPEGDALARQLHEVMPLTRREKERLFGDSLPPGLLLEQ